MVLSEIKTEIPLKYIQLLFRKYCRRMYCNGHIFYKVSYLHIERHNILPLDTRHLKCYINAMLRCLLILIMTIKINIL